MNKSIMMGRVVKDPDLRYTQTENGERKLPLQTFAAVDRKFVRKRSREAISSAVRLFGQRVRGKISV